MSLNRAEQLVFDYVQTHAEERHYWMGKVQSIASGRGPEATGAATMLEAEIWRYYQERSLVASPFRERAAAEGLQRISMRNLAEHWLRLWTSPRPRADDSLRKPGHN